jgi:predicted dehydrogenase
VNEPVRVAIAGCGVISHAYVKNAAAFSSYEIVACSDVNRSAADALAAEHDLRAAPYEELLADPAIDVILNLTPPSAHVAVNLAALAAGKHVYSEKPLTPTAAEAATLLAEADRRGLRIGCAPDTFLSAAFQTARALLDDGVLGEPVAVSASMLVGGQGSWHPNPDMFYTDGAGPLLDMGPYYLTVLAALLGPVRRIAAIASTRLNERTIDVGPRAGERFVASTPTHTAATLELDGGVTASLVASFDAPGLYVSAFTVYGSAAVLSLPDPNGFAPKLTLQRDRGEPEAVAVTSRGPRDARGIGLDDLVRAIGEGRPHRASGRLAHHVVDVARGILAAAEAGRTLDVETTIERPELLSPELDLSRPATEAD